jgi:hypothetical protein
LFSCSLITIHLAPYGRHLIPATALAWTMNLQRNGQGTRYTERPLTDQAHTKETFRSFPGQTKVLDHLHVPDEDHNLDHWIGHRKTQDAWHQDLMKTLSDSHTESDQVLLYGPAAFLANTARILDDFGATQSLQLSIYRPRY